MKLLPDWLRGGNDRELAATKYAGRESATARAHRKDRERVRNNAHREAEASARRRASHRQKVARGAPETQGRWGW
ncbi:hypothetical protein [Streptomyces lasiicapitis]|uniref:Uncharacterized protein n=1 Tax=Streptomyces lasiicapitis TaxID=1923961 RepID=A0ABQ2MXY3_9ACTN|nr:hypothetical protein [Streptomyces lasiicapitis]GGO60098.1 hypothetical protein GCM10012286_83210 [Streptomyces lasiicapitis]